MMILSKSRDTSIVRACACACVRNGESYESAGRPAGPKGPRPHSWMILIEKPATSQLHKLEIYPLLLSGTFDIRGV